MKMADITKADFYEAAEKFFPEHHIKFDKSKLSDRRFTECYVKDLACEKLVMRYCPPNDGYGWPAHIEVFTTEVPMAIDLREDLYTILANVIGSGKI